MGAGPVTVTDEVIPVRRRRSWRWVLLALAAICVVAAIGTYLTAPRPGGRMDPASTGPGGAHALVTLLRDRGVTVVVATSIAEAENAARPGTLLLFAQTQRVASDSLLHRLAATPGDRLLVEPTSRARAALAPGIRHGGGTEPDTKPDCVLREADRAGSVDFGPSTTYSAVSGRAITSCYGGALVRYRDGDRTVTVVGSADFMTNKGLLHAGNAALAMNLAGQQRRLVWYAPQRVEGESSRSTTIFGLIPDNVIWMVLQLWLVVLLIALWKGRRIGPLVAEELPVVVRASETVEGRGRLYRSRRARDRAAQALRAATLQRLLSRLGLGADTSASAVAIAVAQRSRTHEEAARHILFGPPPASDADLVQLARALDDIERQVAQT
jgi:signal peptidase I